LSFFIKSPQIFYQISTSYGVHIKFNELQKRKSIAEAQAKSFMVFIETFKKLPKNIIEWDYRIWNFSIDHATINKDKSIDFLFKNGQNIRVELQK